jgi:site-specific DNA recombinase
MDVAIYARRSRREELEPGEKETSTEQQIRLCRKFAADHNWTVPEEHVYSEAGLSAYTGSERGDFDDALDAVERGAVEGIVFWKVDRATRNSQDTARLTGLLDRDIVLASVTEGVFDPSQPMASSTFELHGIFAKMVSKTISVHARRGKESLARAGGFAGGRRPFGFAKDGVTHDPDEVALIQDAARMVLDGKSLLGIVKSWNRRGVTTAKGGPWDVTVLRRILLSKRVAGLRQYHGQVVGKAAWEPIIDKGTWLDLQAKLTDPDRKKGGRPHTHLLSGIGACHCGRPIRGGKGKKHGRLIYSCGTGSKDRGKGSCGLTIDGKRLEEYVTEKAIKWLAGPGLVGIRRRHAQAGDRQARLARQLQDDGQELRKLAALKAQGRFTLDEWLVLRDGIEQRIKATRRALRRHPATAALIDLPNARDELEAAWKDMDVSRRRVILEAIIERLVIAPRGAQKDDAGRWLFDESRVTLTFRGAEKIPDVPLPSGDADLYVARSWPAP